MFSLGSLGYMVGVMVVDGPLRNFGGVLGTWYLVGLICLRSLIQILRVVTLTVHKVKNELGHQGCLGHFQEGQKGHYQVQEAQEGYPEGCFHNFSVVNLPLVKSVDGLSITGLQSLQCILTQQFIDLRWKIARSIILLKWLLGP